MQTTGIRADFSRMVSEREQEIERLTTLGRQAAEEIDRLNRVASDRWKELKATEKLLRQTEEALRGLWYVAVSDPNGVPKHLQKDVTKGRQALDAVLAARKAKRSRA